MPKKINVSCKPKAKAKAKPAGAQTAGNKKKSPVPPEVADRNKGGRFEPGKSGNPGGLPKGSKQLVTRFRDNIEKALDICEKGGSPLHKLIAGWLIKASPKEAGPLLKALSSFLPKEIEINSPLSEMSEEELDAWTTLLMERLKKS